MWVRATASASTAAPGEMPSAKGVVLDVGDAVVGVGQPGAGLVQHLALVEGAGRVREPAVELRAEGEG